MSENEGISDYSCGGRPMIGTDPSVWREQRLLKVKLGEVDGKVL